MSRPKVLPDKIPCDKCGKLISRYNQTGMCTACWKIGRRRSVKSVDKQKKTCKLKYGNNPPGGFKKGQIGWNKGLHTGDGVDHRKHIPKGKLHGMYIDGRTSLRHKLLYMPEYKKWRIEVFKKDDYTCQKCNIRSAVGVIASLEAHHIKPVIKILREFNINTIDEARINKELWDINNGITLCKKCHNPLKIHHRKQDLKGRFERIV
jgi:hypothetical protein